MENSNAEKNTYGALERFIGIILLPTVFALVLLGVLLSLFDYDVKETVYNIGRKIPIVSYIVPAEDSTDADPGNPADLAVAEENQLAALQAILVDKDEVIEQLKDELAASQQSLQELEQSVESLVLDQEQMLANAEEYRKQLAELAKMYSNMSASKAAPILQNLTMPELVLVLYEMKSDARVRILEKMDPVTAADISMQLKEITEANRLEFETRAKQAREERDQASSPGSSDKLSNAELAQTFTLMAPESAASILLELNKSNSSKVVSILNAMDPNARSQVLSAIADNSTSDAALLAGKLSQ